MKVPAGLVNILQRHNLGLHFGRHPACGNEPKWYLQKYNGKVVASAPTPRDLVRAALDTEYLPSEQFLVRPLASSDEVAA